MVYLKLTQDMYDEAGMSAKSVCRETENFTVKVGVHRGLVLIESPYLFSLVMDELTKGVYEAP